MLRDPRAAALVENFAGQWLHLRNLDTIKPNTDFFPDFDDNLRQAFKRETELFFASIVDENRSILDLLTGDYTFVDERLARHYGIPNVYGSRFRRVTLPPELDARRGLLGKGGVLMATSHADRTAPSLRGKWLLENLLGTPPPAPPANVPPLPAEPGAAPKTMRERLDVHRANPACADCHALDRSARLRARELRRRRCVACLRRRRRRRRERPAARRHAIGRQSASCARRLRPTRAYSRALSSKSS